MQVTEVPIKEHGIEVGLQSKRYVVRGIGIRKTSHGIHLGIQGLVLL